MPIISLPCGGLTLLLCAATAVALAIDLGLHLRPDQHQAHPSNDQSPPFERLRLTWYSLFILDTCLASQLGRMPLTPARHAVSLPAVTGGDEWELMRSESVPVLTKLYAKPSDASGSAPGPAGGSSGQDEKPQGQQQHSSFGQIGPSKALSTFNSAVSIARAAHRALSILNAPNESSDDVAVIAECKVALDSMEADFREYQDPAEREGLSHTTQHKLDLYLRWLYYKQLLEDRLCVSLGSLPTVRGAWLTHEYLASLAWPMMQHIRQIQSESPSKVSTTSSAPSPTTALPCLAQRPVSH